MKDREVNWPKQHVTFTFFRFKTEISLTLKHLN